jgi:hypothetical protein
MSMNDDERQAREWFFNFYGQRIRNAEHIVTVAAPPGRPDVVPSYYAEQHLLIAAGLESLAYHWAVTSGREFPHDRERFSSFLRLHGGHGCFQKCSLPYLLERAESELEVTAPAQQESIRHKIAALRGHLGSASAGGRVRRWTDDPDFSVLEADPAFPDKTSLHLGRYGDMLYKEYRCSWVHEFQGSPKVRPDYDSQRPEPRYENVTTIREDPSGAAPTTRTHAIRLVFSSKFLLDVYHHALERFRQECEAAGSVPGYPPKGSAGTIAR